MTSLEDVDHPRRHSELGFPAVGLVGSSERLVTSDHFQPGSGEEAQVVLVKPHEVHYRALIIDVLHHDPYRVAAGG